MKIKRIIDHIKIISKDIEIIKKGAKKYNGASQVALVVKNLPANAGGARDTSLAPELGRFPTVGNSYPLQYPCLENFMDRGAWWATVHGATKSQT